MTRATFCRTCRLHHTSGARCRHCGGELADLIDLQTDHRTFWMFGSKTRTILDPVATPRRPHGEGTTGIARRHEAMLDGDALAVSWMATVDGEMMVRRVASEPFWLLTAERKILVLGECWVWSPSYERLAAEHVVSDLHVHQLPVSSSEIEVRRRVIADGDRIQVLGAAVTREAHAGSSYRDTVTDVLRGVPGHPLFLDRL